MFFFCTFKAKAQKTVNTTTTKTNPEETKYNKSKLKFLFFNNVLQFLFKSLHRNLTQVYDPIACSHFLVLSYLTVFMDDKESAKIILALKEPSDIKKRGRGVQNFNELWESCGKRKYGKGF